MFVYLANVKECSVCSEA